MHLPNRWYPLKPHPEQIRLIHSNARFRVVPAGRRSGKTERAKRYLIKQAITESISKQYQDYRYFAAAPTRDQAKAIYWADLKAMIDPRWMDGDPRETDLMIRLVTGAEICVIGMDRPQRIEGRPWNGGILDEYANMKPSAWTENVRPALSDRKGWAWLVGVPEGRNHYYQTYRKAQSDDSGEWAAFHWKSADILDPEEIESAKRDLDELTYEQEYEASFVNFHGRAYYPFDERTHCARLTYDPKQPLMFCYDFNVEPGCAAVCQEQKLPNGLQGTGVIGEVWIPRNSNTVAVCKKLLTDWANHEGRITCYGDATGGARGSAKVAGSDWDLIRQTLKHGADGIKGFGDRVIYRVPKANPAERARINAMNSRLKNGAGEIRLMVDPVKAPHVVTDLEGVILLSGGSGELDKRHDESLTHMCFAAETMIDTDQGIFPISEMPKTGKIRTFDGSYVEYISLGMTRKNAETVCVRFDNGDTVICSPDHPFLTEKGFVHAKHLTGLACYNWFVEANQTTKVLAWTQRLLTKILNISMARSTGSIKIPDISPSQRETKKSKYCIDRFGNITMVPYPIDGMYTIKTEINQTTLFPILIAYLQAITFAIMPIQKKPSNVLDKMLKRLIRLIRYGLNLKKEKNSCKTIIKKYLKKLTKRKFPRDASNARPNLWLCMMGLGFVQKNAGLITNTEAAADVKYVIANYAVSCLALQKDLSLGSAQKLAQITSDGNNVARMVLSVSENQEKHDLYCVAVPSTHCFALANGIIVSNSDGLGYYINYEFPVVKATATQTRIKGLY